MSTSSEGNVRILRLNDVEEKTGLSRSTIYLHISKNIFPKPIRLGLRAVGWLESDINSWISLRVQQGWHS